MCSKSSSVRVLLLHWDPSSRQPSELPAASLLTVSPVGSSSWPKWRWMTLRRPLPLRPASVVLQPASPKWSCVRLARLYLTETHWTSLTPVSYSWSRPMGSGQRWASAPFIFWSLTVPFGSLKQCFHQSAGAGEMVSPAAAVWLRSENVRCDKHLQRKSQRLSLVLRLTLLLCRTVEPFGHTWTNSKLETWSVRKHVMVWSHALFSC